MFLSMIKQQGRGILLFSRRRLCSLFLFERELTFPRKQHVFLLFSSYCKKKIRDTFSFYEPESTSASVAQEVPHCADLQVCAP